jgi:hypothetical protein
LKDIPVPFIGANEICKIPPKIVCDTATTKKSGTILIAQNAKVV